MVVRRLLGCVSCMQAWLYEVLAEGGSCRRTNGLPTKSVGDPLECSGPAGPSGSLTGC